MTFQDASRRDWLKWWLASPLALSAAGAWAEALPELARHSAKRPDPMVWTPTEPLELIQTPAQALNVFDFEAAAFAKLPRAHFGYIASGIDDEVTLRANRSSFQKFALRPRRMRDVSRIDLSVNLFGTRWNTPLIFAPTGGNKAYDPLGEVAVTRVARQGGYLNILSSAGASTIEEVVAAREGEVWFQLYATSSVDIAQQIAKRVQRAGVKVMEITVDRNGGRNQETFARLKRQDPRDCSVCHAHGPGSRFERPIYDGLDFSQVSSMTSSNMTWEFIQKMRDVIDMKLVVKGIQTREDALLCLKHGVDGIHVSNHGGRSEDGGRGCIECLPEIAQVARGKVPILFDSGIRRGSDIFKALALGADAVCIGRPYLWGLGAFGQAGVERVFEILKTELIAIMQQMGAPSIASIEANMVMHNP